MVEVVGKKRRPISSDSGRFGWFGRVGDKSGEANILCLLACN